MTGGKVNRGGHGLEVPCVYRLYGPKVYIEKMRVFGELSENSWTSLAAQYSKIKHWVYYYYRGLWLVSCSQTLVARVWLRETRLWPSVRYLEVILY